MSLTALGEVPRPLSRFSIFAVVRIRTSSFFTFFARKKSWSNRTPFVINCQSSDYTIKRNGLLILIVWNSRNCDSREAEKWSGYLSESSQTHFEKTRLDFLAFTGQKQTWKQKKYSEYLFATSKNKVPRTKRPYWMIVGPSAYTRSH